MPVKYFLGWLAAVWLITAPGIVRHEYTTVAGVAFSVLILAGIAYGLAQLGWHLGWFRKP